MGYHTAYFISHQNKPPDRRLKTTKGGGGKLTKTVFFILDNACPHAARLTEYLIEQFRWDVFDHLPYFPNLAPRDLSVHAVRTTSQRTAIQKRGWKVAKQYGGRVVWRWFEKKLLQECIENCGHYVEK